MSKGNDARNGYLEEIIEPSIENMQSIVKENRGT